MTLYWPSYMVRVLTWPCWDQSGTGLHLTWADFSHDLAETNLWQALILHGVTSHMTLLRPTHDRTLSYMGSLLTWPCWDLPWKALIIHDDFSHDLAKTNPWQALILHGITSHMTMLRPPMKGPHHTWWLLKWPCWDLPWKALILHDDFSHDLAETNPWQAIIVHSDFSHDLAKTNPWQALIIHDDFSNDLAETSHDRSSSYMMTSQMTLLRPPMTGPHLTRAHFSNDLAETNPWHALILHSDFSHDLAETNPWQALIIHDDFSHDLAETNPWQALILHGDFSHDLAETNPWQALILHGDFSHDFAKTNQPMTCPHLTWYNFS